MGDSRAQTLASLDAFLDAQYQLLARTQSDLHKLSQLRKRALEQPEEFLESIQQELDDPAFKLSQYEPPQRPQNIDWDLFASFDPSPFSAITLPGPPPLSAATKQRSPPSELQTFVREASKTILANFKPFVPNDEEEANADAEAGAEDEQRLAELVKTGKDTSGSYQAVDLDIDEPQPRRRRVGSGLRLKPSREAVNSASGGDPSSKGKGTMITQNILRAEVDTQSTPSLSERTKRGRRPAARPHDNIPLPPTSSPPPPERILPFPDDDSDLDIVVRIGTKETSDLESTISLASDGESPPNSHAKKKAKRQDSRRHKTPSETFNLPWSISEQHLLEKLLEEIPAGEKQRWAKISKAMAGRRTARQVASRVQKYFEKLKKFGVDPD